MRLFLAAMIVIATGWLPLSAQPSGTPPAPSAQPARGPQSPATQPATCPADRFLYIPPELAPRVRFYHSFEHGLDRPEINLLSAQLPRIDAPPAPGLTGNGLRLGKAKDKFPRCALAGVKLPLGRPLTVSLWFRLEEPMVAESGFNLVALHGRGFISNFVHGKGMWCALSQPTFVLQVYNFPGLSNYNGIWHGPAWVEHGTWHHVAVTVSGGSEVRVYWDAKLKAAYTIEGRLFGPDDVVTSILLGNQGPGIEMTIDEALVLDCAMTPAQIERYTAAVRDLARRKMETGSVLR